MAPTKPRRNHETSGAMASASLTDPFFEVPARINKRFLDKGPRLHFSRRTLTNQMPRPTHRNCKFLLQIVGRAFYMFFGGVDLHIGEI